MPALQLGHLGLGEFAHLGIIAIEVRFVLGDLVGDLAILAHRARDLGHLRALLGERGVLALIGDYGGIAQLSFEVVEVLFDAFDFIVEHWMSRYFDFNQIGAPRRHARFAGNKSYCEKQKGDGARRRSILPSKSSAPTHPSA